MNLARPLVVLVLVAWCTPAAAEGYAKPPQAVLDVLHAREPRAPFLGPTRRALLLLEPVRYPPIADLAAPMLRLAGVRVDPRTNGEHGAPYGVGLTVQPVPDGAEVRIPLPAGARIGAPRWNVDGSMVAFTNTTAAGVELWVADLATRRARRLPGLKLNPLLGHTVQWMADQKTLLVKLVPARRAPPPAAVVPPAPKVQESAGAPGASSTYETRDVLSGPRDAEAFDYYMTAQLALVHVPSGKVTRLGAPAVYGQVARAPGGRHILVERIHRPYSYQRTWPRFPKDVELWSPTGARLETLARLPLFDAVPIDGVPTGPRGFEWRPTEPATLVWVEALDGGDPNTKVPHRDRVLLRRLDGSAVRELGRTEHRFAGAHWLERGGLVLITEHDRDRRWRRTAVVNADDPAAPRRTLWDMSADERYRHPGYPVYRPLPSGAWAVLEQDGAIFLGGQGSSREGDRPFLDRLSLRTLTTERLFRSERKRVEQFIAWVDPAAGAFITRRESPSEPPNFVLRTLAAAGPAAAPAPGEAARTSTARAITHDTDPTPQVRGITKRRVTYQRADGVPLSFTLYLPPGYREGTRLPTLVWAYPLDYADKAAAGQMAGSPWQFTRLVGASPLFFALQGYAVLDQVAMPVVGPPPKIYDTFIEQIVANARAAVDKAVALGVTDPERIGVMGHSHGALMTVNLLAHSDLFRAGIARSGAYNRTLTAFGFQSEKRTLWQAPDVYLRVSPLFHADKIKRPLLLIHGELDRNPGTVPLQSEKLYEAVRALGGEVRLVMLPHEDHGYRARESVEHALHEMLAWFDRHVKHAPPRARVEHAPPRAR
jgi:dipeptidyl aminopeptidase/acylaminoacyl peptidase